MPFKSNPLKPDRFRAVSPTLHSAPLAGVQVVLRNQATGTAAQTTTAKNGAFSFASLDAGEYTLEADAPQLGQGRLEGILINGGMEARVQAAIRFEPTAPALLEAAAAESNRCAGSRRAHAARCLCTASTRTGRRPSCANDGFGIALDHTARLCASCLCSAGPPVRARRSEPSSHDRAVTPIRCRFGVCGNPSACCAQLTSVAPRPALNTVSPALDGIHCCGAVATPASHSSRIAAFSAHALAQYR